MRVVIQQRRTGNWKYTFLGINLRWATPRAQEDCVLDVPELYKTKIRYSHIILRPTNSNKMSHTPVSSSTHDRDNTGILYDVLTGHFSKSVPKMKPYSVIVFLALLLTVHGNVNDTTISAGFGSDILSGLNRLVNKITNRNNVTANVTTTNVTGTNSNVTANVTTTNVTGTNSTGLPLEIVCPPPTPNEVFSTIKHSCNKT